MARKFNTDVLKRSDGIGGFQGVPAMCGESSYDIARRNGFTGTEIGRASCRERVYAPV